MYELFAISHKIISLATLLLLWCHIDLKGSFAVICLGSVSGLWTFQQLVWMGFLIYRNFGSEIRNTATIIGPSHGDSQISQIRIILRRPWNITPGQYVYVTMPSIPHLFIGAFQAHPFVIAWSNVENDKTELILLVKVEKGFSRAVSMYRDHSYVIVDGPYGKSIRYNDFDKVLFIGYGIGIAAHLIPVRHLIRAHNNREARARRISLVWIMESDGDDPSESINLLSNLFIGQELSVMEFILDILQLDVRRIFTCYLLSPSSGPSNFREERRGLWRCRSLDIDWLIHEEWNAEAGNMLVSSM